MGKFISIITLLLVSLILLISHAFAEEDPSVLPYLVKQNAGFNGFANPEVTMSDSMLNPASLCSSNDIGFKGFVSTSYGNVNFDGGRIGFNSVSYSDKIKKMYLNINLYRTSCTSINFLSGSVLAGNQANFNVDVAELAMGYKLDDNLAIGASWILNENSHFALKNAEFDIPLMDSESKSPVNFRLGLRYQLNQQLTIASVYGRRDDNYRINLHPAYTGFVDEIQTSSSYKTQTWTHGISFRPRQGTTFFYNHQYVHTDSPNGRINYDLSYFGVEQWLNRNISLRIVSNNHNPEYSINYFNVKSGIYAGFSYREGGTVEIDNMLGKQKRIFFVLGKYF